MSEIPSRKSIPIIGAISCGKSLFLDSLLGLDLLEIKSTTSSKFVCIIRHNNNLTYPIFYHIKLKESGKDTKTGMTEYKAIKDGEVIEGNENIKEKIKQINQEQKNIDDNEIKYDELFYVLEIKINYIKNEELLNNYDFYDIPGLDEYITGDEYKKKNDDSDDENNNNVEDKNKRFKYIDNLFKYFRSRIDFGVFMLNAESAYANSSNDVIANVSNILKPKKIKNYLIILNKIDRKSNQDEACKEVKSILVNDLIDQINLVDNTFISLDSRQIKHQNLLRDNFEDFLLFLFNQYVTKAVMPFKDNKNLNEELKKKFTKNYSFSNYLYDFIFKDGMTDEEKNSYLDNLTNQFEQDGLNLNELGIYDIIEKIKNIENFVIEFDIDKDKEDSNKLLKSLYIIFKDKIKLPFSQQVFDVYDYFETILDKIKKENPEEESTIPSYLLNQENLVDYNFFDKFDQFILSFQSNDDDLDDKIASLYNSVFYQQFFYIGIFGMSSTGKSSILNSILGYDILPVYQNECTKRGIIIEYGEEIALYKAKSELKELKFDQSILIFMKIGKLATGVKNVKEYLTLLNSNYAKNTSNQNYDYFIVTLPIKFLDEIKIDEKLKKIIRFIDLPGSNIKTAQNNFSYDKIINSISLFIFNFTNSTIGSVDNIFNKKIFTKFEENDIPCKDALKNFLFTINIYQNDELNENDWAKKIKNLLCEVYTEEKNETIELKNFSYLNAKSCRYYIKSKNYYCKDYKQLFDDILKIYKEKQEKSSFSDFIVKYIKADIMDAFSFDLKELNEIIGDGQYNNEIFSNVNNVFKDYSNITKEENNLDENIKTISSCITFIKNNIKSTKYYRNSYYEQFLNDLNKSIESTLDFKSQYVKKYFTSSIERFTYYFNYDEEYRILNFTKYFDSFFSIFRSYKKFNFSLPGEIFTLKNTIDSKHDYYKLKKEVRGYGPGPTKNTKGAIEWSNGIIAESDFPKVYLKTFRSEGDGKAFKKIKLVVDEKFDDLIVGWKINDNWKDGTNGDWVMEGNPLLTNKIKVEFTSQAFRGQCFTTSVYLLEYPK